MRISGRSPLHFYVGQTLWVRGRNRRTLEECTVTKIGRELVHLSAKTFSTPLKFDPATGVVRDFGIAFLTQEDAERADRLAVLRRQCADELRTAELTPGKLLDVATLLGVPVPDRLKQLLGVRP